MAGLNSSVDQLLGKMRTSTQTGKGTFGEQAVFKICEQLYQTQGGILVHSYSYKTDKDLAGNIKKDKDGKLFVENTGGYTEIDVLYVSKFRVFPIEVKAYTGFTDSILDHEVPGERNIVLLETGLEAAETVLEKHEILTEVLVKYLQLDPTIAMNDACRIEHVISDETFDALKKLL